MLSSQNIPLQTLLEVRTMMTPRKKFPSLQLRLLNFNHFFCFEVKKNWINLDIDCYDNGRIISFTLSHFYLAFEFGTRMSRFEVWSFLTLARCYMVDQAETPSFSNTDIPGATPKLKPSAFNSGLSFDSLKVNFLPGKQPFE